MPRVRIPADVARVLETHLQLGHAARRALWLSEKQTAAEVREAARRARALRAAASKDAVTPAGRTRDSSS